VALSERNEARDSAEAAGAAELDADVRALRAQALAEPEMDRALLLAAQAHRLEPSAASRSTLLEVAQRSPELDAVHRVDQRLQHVAASDDGRWIAAVGAEGGVYAWEAATGDLAASLTGVSFFGGTSLDMSADGSRLVMVGVPVAPDPAEQSVEGQAIIVDLTDARPRARPLSGPPVVAARFTRDGSALVELTVEGSVRRVDSGSGAPRPGPDRRVEAPATALLVEDTALDASPGRRYLAASDLDGAGVVTVWDGRDGEVLWTERRPTGAVAAVSPDGRKVVVGQDDGGVELVRLPTGSRTPVPADLAGGVSDLAFSPDGTEFAGASTGGSVTTWDARSLAPTRVLGGHTGGVGGVAYLGEGRRLMAVGDDGSVLVWRLTGTSGLVASAGGAERTDAFGSVMATDGSLVATQLAEDVVRLWEPGRGTTARMDLDAPGRPAGMFISPAGDLVGHLSSGWPTDSALGVRVIDAATGTQRPFAVRLTPSSAFDARFSGDGRVLVTADDDVVTARSVRTGRAVPETPSYRAAARVPYLGVDQDGDQVALMEQTGKVEIVDLVRGRRLAMLDPTPDEDSITSRFEHLTYSPDGRWLATGADNGTVVVWDTRTWEVAATWGVTGGSVQSIAFTADSRSVLVGGGGTASIRKVTDPLSSAATVDLDPLRSGGAVQVGSRGNGQVMVTHTPSSGVQAWNVSAEALVAHACRVAGRDLTEDEWAAALPDRPYERTCP
jgi:WD40 repeat protein